jgi:hypothetical protein
VQHEQQTGMGFELMGCGLLRELMLDANIPGRTALVLREGARSADQTRLVVQAITTTRALFFKASQSSNIQSVKSRITNTFPQQWPIHLKKLIVSL